MASALVAVRDFQVFFFSQSGFNFMFQLSSVWFLVNWYGAVNSFRRNRRSKWPNFPVQRRSLFFFILKQECINKTATSYRSLWHELIYAFPQLLWPSLEFSKLLSFHPRKGREPGCLGGKIGKLKCKKKKKKRKKGGNLIYLFIYFYV